MFRLIGKEIVLQNLEKHHYSTLLRIGILKYERTFTIRCGREVMFKIKEEKTLKDYKTHHESKL